jgi:hypothetical protein
MHGGFMPEQIGLVFELTGTGFLTAIPFAEFRARLEIRLRLRRD